MTTATISQEQLNETLNYASKKGLTDIAKMMISKGANVNASEENSFATPLINAVYYGNPEVVEVLLIYGADMSTVPLQLFPNNL